MPSKKTTSLNKDQLCKKNTHHTSKGILPSTWFIFALVVYGAGFMLCDQAFAGPLEDELADSTKLVKTYAPFGLGAIGTATCFALFTKGQFKAGCIAAAGFTALSLFSKWGTTSTTWFS